MCDITNITTEIMLAQTRQSRRAPRRAMSADQALERKQERDREKVDAAILGGQQSKLQKNMNVTIKTLSGGSIQLVSADGTVTDAGRHYYTRVGVDPPTICAYEQPLESGMWVRGVDGKKKQVRRRTSDGWTPTKSVFNTTNTTATSIR